jgi:hypothetical protein
MSEVNVRDPRGKLAKQKIDTPVSMGKIHWGKISQQKMPVNTAQKSFVRWEPKPPSK